MQVIQNDQLSIVSIKREMDPRLNSYDELYENEIFDGATNPLIFDRYYTLNLRCNYNFYYFPFDHQPCKIKVSVFDKF